MNKQIATEEQTLTKKVARLRHLLNECDALVIGAGAGLSTAAGHDYSGQRFREVFSEFEKQYGFSDCYAGGFYPYETPEESWAFWSKNIMLNRFSGSTKLYQQLKTLVQGHDYFVLTTNVDHQFQLAGFDKKRLFYTQGDYGLFQCSEPCCSETYDNFDAVTAMVEQQSDCRIPSKLLPMCPHCGKPLAMNLRSDDTFVQDDGWYRAADRYQEFLRRHENMWVLFLELGVGFNTPGIIKYPFMRMTWNNPRAHYVCINAGEAVTAQEIRNRSLCINADISEVVDALMREEHTDEE